ncbi:MAG TPA: PPOX class F420-dependent oxidoreductase [Candidatus Xenobia bacterium]
MAVQIPDKFKDLFDKKAFANLATLNPDGSPQVSPVWCELDGNTVIVNSVVGRHKDKNIKRDKRVALAISDPDNAYRYLEIRGKVVNITTDGGAAGIDKLAKKYMGVDKYPYHRPEDTRVVYRIEVEHTASMG